MNSKMLNALMALHGDTQRVLAEYLGIQQPTFCNKKNGKSEFTRDEIQRIKERYNLSAEEIDRIFF